VEEGGSGQDLGDEKRGKRKREREISRGRGWLYMHTRTFRCQSRLGIFGFWGVGA